MFTSPVAAAGGGAERGEGARGRSLEHLGFVVRGVRRRMLCKKWRGRSEGDGREKVEKGGDSRHYERELRQRGRCLREGNGGNTVNVD